MCWPLGRLWHTFLQDIHVLVLHGPNAWKIMIDQMIPKNWKRVLAWPSYHYSHDPWSFFVIMGNTVAHDVLASLIYFYFIYTLFLFCKSKRYMCLCNVRKCYCFRRIVKPSLTRFSLDGIQYATSFSPKFD